MYEYLIKVAKTPKKITLTDALMETLSIIAYKQPITRLDVERIRGVNSDHAVNRLVEFNLFRNWEDLMHPEDLFCSEQQRSSLEALECAQ